MPQRHFRAAAVYVVGLPMAGAPAKDVGVAEQRRAIAT